MIVYDKLWETMKEKGISQYKLIKDYGISTGQLDRLRKTETSTPSLSTLFAIYLNAIFVILQSISPI